MNWLAYVRKSLTSLFGGVLVWAQLVPNFGHLTRGDWIGLAIVVGSAWGVYSVANGDRPVKAPQPVSRAPLAPPAAPVVQAQVTGAAPEPAPADPAVVPAA